MPPAAPQAQQNAVTDAGPLGIHLLAVDAAAVAREAPDQRQAVGGKAPPGTAPLSMSGNVGSRDRVGSPVAHAVADAAAAAAFSVTAVAGPPSSSARRGVSGGVETCGRDGRGRGRGRPTRRGRRQHRRREGTPAKVLQFEGGRLNELVFRWHG